MSITLGQRQVFFENLTFTQAKVIDISWDIIIGRLGQILMAFISWRAFADYVTTSMELAPVTYTTYFTMFLESEPSFFSTFRVMRVFISERGLKSRVSMIFIVWSMLFLIGWPTLASAMTGYTTLNKAFVPDNNGNYIPFSDFQPIAYIIHDGWRVNLTSDQVVSYFRSTYTSSDPIIYSLRSFFDEACNIDSSRPCLFTPDCSLQNAVSACWCYLILVSTPNLTDANFLYYCRCFLEWILWPPKYVLHLELYIPFR
ncbi:hypothetical protein M434DRAFT_290086 [Hypoxylon sp. CO27-5]|nr:hypothetical protein M434DRAFT_290086 [Hypoxylon sp. CO27-5]